MNSKYLVVLIVLINIVLGQVDVSIPDRITGDVGDIIDIPITVSELDGQHIISFETKVEYNKNFEIIGVEETDISSSFIGILYNTIDDGTTIIAGYGANELKGSGAFLNIKIKLLENSLSNFTLTDFTLNDIIYPVNPLELIIGDVKFEEENILNDFQLNQNYPNPFNPSTNIEFSLNRSAIVNLSIFDLSGRLIDNLVNDNQKAGIHKVHWNGMQYPSGVYIYSINMLNKDGTEIFRDIKRMTLIK